ncbi:MAG TPA: hypothetical protein VGK49_00950, partial [Ilumatobacteraceae bacterium]
TRIRMDEFGNLQQFATGGVVAGPVGQPTLAVVHGGERVLTPAQQAAGTGVGGVQVVVNHYGRGEVVPEAVVEAIVKHRRRNGSLPWETTP